MSIETGPRPTVPRHTSGADSRVLFERIPLPALLLNATGVVVLANADAERLFGAARGALVGQPLDALIPGRDRGAHPVLRDGLQPSTSARRVGAGRDLIGVRADLSEFPIEVRVSALDLDGAPHMLACVLDLTEHRQSETALRAAVDAKETLLREIHHRVKNNLQLVSSLLHLQAANVQDPAVLALFRDSQRQVRALALLHEHLYRWGTFAPVDLGEYVRELASLVANAHAPASPRVRIEFITDRVLVGYDTAMSLGLIASEALSNCFKHAFPGDRGGTIRVTLRRGDGDRIALTIADDGVGISDGESNGDHPSQGLRLVRILAQQLHAQLDVTGPPGSTLRVMFTTPRASKGHNGHEG